MYSTLSACRAYTYMMLKAVDKDIDDMTNHECAALIMYVSEKATQVALEGVQMLGGNGYGKCLRGIILCSDDCWFQI